MNKGLDTQSPHATINFDANLYRHIFPSKYINACLEQNVRTDSRAFNNARTTHIQNNIIEQSPSSSLVKIGQTTVVTAITLAVGTPSVSTPDHGELAIQVHLTPLCSNRYHIGRPSEESQSIGSQLTRIVIGSRMLEMSDLIIEKGKSAWYFHIDVYGINHDGNMLDAALLSIVVALKNLRLPVVSINETDHVVTIQPDEPTTEIQLMNVPISTSFAIIGEKILMDPSSLEEQHCQSIVTITYNEKGLLCGVQKSGGQIIAPGALQHCMKLAKEHSQKIFDQVKSI